MDSLNSEPTNKKLRLTNNLIRNELKEPNLLKELNKIYNDELFYQIKTEPFRHIIIDDIIKETHFVEKLLPNLKEIALEEKSSDLYKFAQSQDLFSLETNNENLKYILDFLKNDCVSLLSSLTGANVEGKTSASISVYEKNDYLLCHDDLSEDRLFAYILYLNKDWNPSDGGQLQLYSRDENGLPSTVHSNYFPKFNRMIFFEVTSTSYHQVKEVVGETKRITINGWFHGKSEAHKKLDFKPIPSIPSCRELNNKVISLKEIIHELYLESAYLEKIRHHIVKQSAVYMGDFFKEELLKKINKNLSLDNLNWQNYGPPNHRCCIKLQINDCPTELFDFICIFYKPQFIKYLEELCKMTINIPSTIQDEKIQVHIHKWSPGTYTLVHDNDLEFKIMTLELLVFFLDKEFNENNGGTHHYIARDADEELATLVPANNSLSIVLRDHETVRFTKYLNSLQNTFYSISILYTDIQVPDATSSSSSSDSENNE